MSKIVNDKKNLPLNILQVEMKTIEKFLTTTLLDSLFTPETNKMGIKRNNYYMINPHVMLRFKVRTKETEFMLRLLEKAITQGADLLMIKF